jgi:hypothetical protein
MKFSEWTSKWSYKMKLTLNLNDDDAYYLLDLIYEGWSYAITHNEYESEEAARRMYNDIGQLVAGEEFVPIEKPNWNNN